MELEPLGTDESNIAAGEPTAVSWSPTHSSSQPTPVSSIVEVNNSEVRLEPENPEDDSAFLSLEGVLAYSGFLTAPSEYVSVHAQTIDPVPAEPICLTWSPIIRSELSFCVNRRDDDYSLYAAAFEHFQSQFSSTDYNPPVLDLTDLPPVYHVRDEAFKDLINALADRYCKDTDSAEMNFSTSSTLDFLLYGALPLSLAAMDGSQRGMRSVGCCKSLQLMGAPSELDLGRAAFLDTVTTYWSTECAVRRHALCSPMPWSKASAVEQIPQYWSDPRRTLVDLGSATILDDPELTQYLNCSRGRMLDIPWLSGPHNGSPFCPTLGAYTRLRRLGKISSCRDDAALWLAAMTFGVLEIATDLHVPEKLLLISGEGGQATISSERLSRFMFSWIVDAQKLKFADKAAHGRRGIQVSQVVSRALVALREETFRARSILLRAGLPEKDCQDIICAVGMMLLALCHSVAIIWQDIPECRTLLMAVAQPTQYHVITDINKVYRRKLLEAGWCKNTISVPFVQAAGYRHLSNMAWIQPFIRTELNEHDVCTESACKFYTLDSASYACRHVVQPCQCEFIAPSLSDITRLLSKNKIPVVVYEGDKLVVRAASEVPYVAISHVWADGLGSTTEVGLPRCQLSRIASLAAQLLPATPAFWMDSICVPGTELRKEAIKLMAQTYSDAAKVLVLDAGIRAQCRRTAPWVENILRIGTSGWVRRVWTLQEGMLARELFFEFADGIVDSEVLEALNGEERSLLPGFHDDIVPLFSFRPRRRQQTPPPCTLEDLIMLLQWRTTTKPEDESIAIAGLLPLDVRELLSITGVDAAERRMKSLLLQLQKVPIRFPLLPTIKLNLPGFRWAPRRLAEAVEFVNPLGYATCTENGLIGRYTLCRFERKLLIPPAPEGDNLDRPTAWLRYRPTGRLYELTIYVDSLTANPRLIQPWSLNCLLVTEEELPSTDRDNTHCAVVSQQTGQMDEGTESEVRCDYFAPANLCAVVGPDVPGVVDIVELTKDVCVRLV